MKPTGTDRPTKADRAARAAKVGVQIVKGKKIRTSVTFRRPDTLKLPRDPKYPRKALAKKPKLDDHQVIKYPLTTESAMKMIEDHNTIVFIVDVRANKPKIKAAVAKMYEIQAVKVNTLVRPDGQKKAYVRLTKEHEALDVASKIGII
ncbi:60S ribosomal protein L23a [Gracilariopsis chorda]|uniref:60S ribosomal protein L23a n=1 Tax=Gracilariopsis chorda TaxID=448386 RepID=A0A2V3IF03_9FLOR|nr:60S ribosomal protein L23a [Gracilariopsis chorda]|eukprot:PXF40598.1 60S ribosomal protein L23a [Gracilariopsis chorda]